MAASESAAPASRKQQTYRCFLVRCRLEEGAGPGGEPAWRFTVQQAGAAQARRSFTCLADAAAHIEAELASCTPGRKVVP